MLITVQLRMDDPLDVSENNMAIEPQESRSKFHTASCYGCTYAQYGKLDGLENGVPSS